MRPARTAAPGTRPLSASTPGGHVDRHHRRAGAGHPLHRRGGRPRAARPCAPVPSRASTTTAPAGRPGAERPDRGCPGWPRSRPSTRRRASPAAAAGGHHLHVPARLGQVARDDHPVAAVVARADDDARGAGARERGQHRLGGGQPGALHQQDRGHAVVLGRPPVGLAQAGGVEERRAPGERRGGRGSGGRHGAPSSQTRTLGRGERGPTAGAWRERAPRGSWPAPTRPRRTPPPSRARG